MGTVAPDSSLVKDGQGLKDAKWHPEISLTQHGLWSKALTRNWVSDSVPTPPPDRAGELSYLWKSWKDGADCFWATISDTLLKPFYCSCVHDENQTEPNIRHIKTTTQASTHNKRKHNNTPTPRKNAPSDANIQQVMFHKSTPAWDSQLTLIGVVRTVPVCVARDLAPSCLGCCEPWRVGG